MLIAATTKQFWAVVFYLAGLVQVTHANHFAYSSLKICQANSNKLWSIDIGKFKYNFCVCIIKYHLCRDVHTME